MAKLLEAVRDYGPQTKLNSTLCNRDLASFIAMRTGVQESQVTMILQELKTSILFFNRQGTPVVVPGLGRYAPGIDRHGRYRINIMIDKGLRKGINEDGAYSGRLENRQNIKLDNAGYKALWDADHPNDPLEI